MRTRDTCCWDLPVQLRHRRQLFLASWQPWALQKFPGAQWGTHVPALALPEVPGIILEGPA